MKYSSAASTKSEQFTRIELRKRGLCFHNLLELPNPFLRLGLAELSSLKPLDVTAALFVMAAQGTNGQSALLKVPPHTRKKFKTMLAAASPKWWSPVELWKQWPSVVANLLEPPPLLYSVWQEDVPIDEMVSVMALAP